MLVLSRKKNESIQLGSDIALIVVDIRGDKVRLGVECPKEIPVHRREVFEAIKKQGGTVPSIGGTIASLQADNERLRKRLRELEETI